MIRVRQIKVPIEKDKNEFLLLKIAHKLNIKSGDIEDFKIVKKSIDARDKNHILFVYEVDVVSDLEKSILKKSRNGDVLLTPFEKYTPPEHGTMALKNRVVIVGAGPAGLFCAYLLAEEGYRPIIIERGEKMEDRVKTVEEFFKNNWLDINSNVQFGEGGAGTFSDGKLNTLVKDKLHRGKKVFDIFVENGAPEEILYLQKPHIGTDILRTVIVNIRNKILSLGGEFYYQSTVTDLIVRDGSICGIEINGEKRMDCQVLVLAIGHSARDTFSMLYEKGLSMKAKNFAVGVRIEHPQEMISKSQYGEKYSLLPPASYKLTYQASNGRGVYSFCMCPGGFVVNASSESECLAINGMSNYKREEANANSAIVVTVTKDDFGEGVLAGVEFQRMLEKKAYEIGNGFIPVQLYKDFLQGQRSEKLGEVIPNTKGKYSLSDLNLLFPSFISDSLKEAIPYFGEKIQGFDREDAILLGVESRTSSPVIIERNEDLISSFMGVYPCGEGAGYAGGITTAAMDGVKVAEAIIKMYSHLF